MTDRNHCGRLYSRTAFRGPGRYVHTPDEEPVNISRSVEYEAARQGSEALRDAIFLYCERHHPEVRQTVRRNTQFNANPPVHPEEAEA